MNRSVLLERYRVEYEAYGQIHFVNGDDWRIQIANYERSKKLYQEVCDEFSKMVDELSDGLWIDLSRFEELGKWLWFSRQFFTDFEKMVI